MVDVRGARGVARLPGSVARPTTGHARPPRFVARSPCGDARPPGTSPVPFESMLGDAGMPRTLAPPEWSTSGGPGALPDCPGPLPADYRPPRFVARSPRGDARPPGTRPVPSESMLGGPGRIPVRGASLGVVSCQGRVQLPGPSTVSITGGHFWPQIPACGGSGPPSI